jgi:hypothetical protein
VRDFKDFLDANKNNPHVTAMRAKRAAASATASATAVKRASKPSK